MPDFICAKCHAQTNEIGGHCSLGYTCLRCANGWPLRRITTPKITHAAKEKALFEKQFKFFEEKQLEQAIIKREWALVVKKYGANQ